MCSFPLGDLDVQGELCAFVIAVADVPSPRTTGITREDARDIFVLLDPRPLGCKPHFLLLQYPTVHLPTIIAHLGLSTSPAARIGVAGGERRGDEIHVDNNATLLLFAEPKPINDSDSSSSSLSRQVSPWEDEPEPAVAHQLPDDQSSAPAMEPDDVWGQLAGSPSQPTQVFVDPTLPPGQSWNEGVPETTQEEFPQDPGPARAANSETARADTQSQRRPGGRSRRQGRRQALVYVPDFVPEIIEVDVSEPVTFSTLLAIVRRERLEEQSSSFPDLHPVSPQPVQHFPILVATPSWAVDTVVILCDCLGYDGTIFAKVVSAHTCRESLMLAAGIPTDAPVNVWAHRSLRPLSVDQSVLMHNGSTVQFVPWRTDAPPCYDLEQVLALENWEPDSPLPGPRTHFNGYFWILSDDRPFPFEVRPDRRSAFKQDVAASLGVPVNSLTLKPSTPRVLDAFPFGFWTSGILVATQKLSRAPHLSAGQPETRSILILDQRRMLRGIAWRLVNDSMVTVQDIADMYYDTCPFGYEVSIRGADVFQLDGEEVLQIRDGQVIVVEFTPESTSSVTGPDLPPPSDVPAAAGEQSDVPPAAAAVPGATDPASQPRSPPRQRSRSPRPATHDRVFKARHTCQGVPLVCLNGRLLSEVLCPTQLTSSERGAFMHIVELLRTAFDVVQNGKASMWSLDLPEYALAVSSPSLTPALVPFDTRLAPAQKFSTQLSQLLAVGLQGGGKTCKLLDEPRSGTSADAAVDGARTAARLLNTPWPFPPFQWPTAHDPDTEMLSEDSQTEVRTTTDIVVFLLTPDYVPEQLDLTVELPQPVQELIDLVQVCRDRDRHLLFPQVVEVTPQPDPGWGIFLAIPSWVQDSVVLCLDLSLFDGRIFAISIPDRCRKHLLCAAAGLAPTAEVDIFVPGMPFALLPDTDCHVQTGMCLTFVRVGRQRPPTFSLPAMLCTHIPWEHSPVFPRDRLNNGICAVGPRGPVLFRLHPERSFYYRADIALMTELHPFRVILTPAAPQPTDVCVRGWTCRAVVGATDRQERTTWDGDVTTPTIGLVDGRPLLRGWITVSTWDSWLDLAPVRWIFQQFVPPGWHIVFPGLPSHWTWLCFVPGQILTVALAPLPAPSGALPPGTSLDTGDDGHFEAAPALFEPVPRYDASVPPFGAGLGSADSGLRGHGHDGTGRTSRRRRSRPVSPGDSVSRVVPFFCSATGYTLLWALCLAALHAIACTSWHHPLAIYACLLPRHAPLGFIGSVSLSLLLSSVPTGAVHFVPPGGEQPYQDGCGIRSFVDRRPVPTPCRSGVFCVGTPLRALTHCDIGKFGETDYSSWALAIEDPLVTLLGEAAAESDQWAFLAATLLDTLLDHFTASSYSPTGGALLRLADHLPTVRTHDLTAATVDLGPFFASAGRLILPGSWPLACALPANVTRPVDLQQLRTGSPPLLEPLDEAHIYTDGSYNGEVASWAFAVILDRGPVCSLYGWASGRVSVQPEDPWFIGALEHTPLVGEQSALIWAILWAMQSSSCTRLKFYSDCLVALRQTTGRFGSKNEGALSNVCRHLFQALEASRPAFQPDIQHVRAHRGIAANELVDRLAKQAGGLAARVAEPSSHQSFAIQWCRSSQLSWLWLAFEAMRQPWVWPAFDGSHFADIGRTDTEFRPTPAQCRGYFGLSVDPGTTSAPADIQGRLCTFTLNTQTLEGTVLPQEHPSSAGYRPDGQHHDMSLDSHHFPGKAAFLREQFDHYGAHLVALQEARAPADGMFVSATHIRLCTGRDPKGNFGVELWFSRRHPFAWLGKTALYFDPAHLLVLHSSPRELFVRYCRGSLRILLVSVHGPVATCPTRPAWWRAFKSRVDQLCHGSQLFILGDLNMHFAAPIAGSVGDKVFPTKHDVPDSFVSLLHQHRLWIPSTFPECHPLDHVTWFPPTGGPGARLDYVVLPRSWQVEDGGSQVFTALDWGQTRVDHLALRTFVSFQGLGAIPARSTRPSYDREAMLTEDGRAALADIFASVPPQPWHSNVHEHYAAVQQHVVSALSVAFPPAKRHCRSSHFSPSTWQKRIWLRRQTLRIGPLAHMFERRCAFFCLRTGCSLVAGRYALILRLGRDLIALASHASSLRNTKQSLRQAIRRDVGHRIHDTASTAPGSTVGGVVSRLQSLLGPSARKSKPPRRLPGLTLGDGTPAKDPADVESAWVSHFSGIEDGAPRSPEELAQSCLLHQRRQDVDEVDFLASDLPTRSELEAAFRDTALHRAYGVDGIPAEALHSAPGAAAAAFFPVILKASLRLAEPIQFKGGSLFAIWKGKASPGLCSSYRGILVSSTVGKAYHKIIRGRNIPALQQAATPLQIGGLPKCPVTLAAQIVRLHQSWAAQTGASQATLFLDLREAFYRIVRPLVTGFTGTDEDVARILQSVNLPPGTMHELCDHLRAPSLFEDSGSTSWVSAVTCEALHHTWFRFEQGSLLTQTGIGTRPGDNLADLVFSFVFARVLRQVRQDVGDIAALTELPWHPAMLDNVCEVSEAATGVLSVLDSTWMDDAAFVLRHHSAATLIQHLGRTAGALLDGCLGRALLPNLDRGKTEAIVSLQGSGSRKARADLFRAEQPSIPARSRLWPDAHIRLVAQYQHLGGTIHHTGALQREIKHRIALAWQAFNKRRKKIFTSPVVARTDKVVLFDSLVLSVLLYGAGTWCDVDDKALMQLSSAYHHMVASMLRPQYRVEEAKHLGPARILMLAGLPSMPVLLHLSRLRHLHSCVTVAIKEFWALAHAEGTWLCLVRASLGWLRALLPSQEGSDDWATSWPQWVGMMRGRPGAWKRLLRTAQSRAVRQEAWIASCQGHRGLLSRQLQAQGGTLICPPPDDWDRKYCCAPCGKVFATRQRWAVHAFKSHGRLASGRGLLTGHQCQHCLRHFGTNLKLCKHLAYSRACRHSLSAAGFSCAPQPGQGHRLVEDAGRSQAPVLQAEGPCLEPHRLDWLDAVERPIAEVMDCLSCLCEVEDHITDGELWRRLKLAFSCVCGDSPRLRITAQSFLSHLRATVLPSSAFRLRLIDALEWISSADIVEWLVPAPDSELSAHTTFRDSEIVLGMLEVAHISFPCPDVARDSCTWLTVGPDSWCKLWPSHPGSTVSYTLEECLEILAQGSCPAFFEGPFDSVVCVLCITPWHGFQHQPSPSTPARPFRAQLDLEVLCGDIARLALRLWGLGVPTTLLYTAVASTALAPLPEVGSLEAGLWESNLYLRNRWAFW